MTINDLDYELPEELIAQTPLEPRDSSRLLHLNRFTGELYHRNFLDVAELLNPGDLLIMNNTRVSAMRLFGKKSTGADVEALLLNEVQGGRYTCLLRPAKRLPLGTKIAFEDDLVGTVIGVAEAGQRVISFSENHDFRARLEAIGLAAVPPYVKTQLKNKERYQTVFAQHNGSAAAPTAGLHFTKAIIDRLIQKGIEVAYVTLHVGLDTFRPIQSSAISEIVMHGEICEIPPETVEKVAKCQGRIIAVGTTTVRTLETLATGKRTLQSKKTVSKLLITPGFEFKIVDGMFTNFHMPRTTMLLMISALSSPENIKNAYKNAVNLRYRFLSFGDSMLIL